MFIEIGKYMVLGGLFLVLFGAPVFFLNKDLGETVGRGGCLFFMAGSLVFALGCLAAWAGV